MQSLVESLLLVCFSIEVLHSLEVEKRVCRLTIIVLIGLRHLFEALGSPLGHAVSNEYVQQHCSKLEQNKLPRKEGAEHNQDQHYLNDDWG